MTASGIRLNRVGKNGLPEVPGAGCGPGRVKGSHNLIS